MKNILTQEEINTIHELCKEYKIKDYTINPDGSIDVDGNVYLNNCNLTKIPLKFNTVSGNFNCGYNKLTSLKHCPNKVGISFSCGYNKLTSLEYAPTSIQGYFDCSNNKLTSLEHCTKTIVINFYCNNNEISSLLYCPTSITGFLYCHNTDLPGHFINISETLNQEEFEIFLKYHHDLRIWSDGGYDEQTAQELVEEIKDGLK